MKYIWRKGVYKKIMVLIVVVCMIILNFFVKNSVEVSAEEIIDNKLTEIEITGTPASYYSNDGMFDQDFYDK
ncbi:MAG: hypothetical protein IJ272_09365, partial [Clostridia bacterium]|nr:hypothetical protein [Clostridia bacterium]